MKLIINPDTHFIYIEDKMGNRFLLKNNCGSNQDAALLAEKISQILGISTIFIQGDANKIPIPKKG